MVTGLRRSDGYLAILDAVRRIPQDENKYVRVCELALSVEVRASGVTMGQWGDPTVEHATVGEAIDAAAVLRRYIAWFQSSPRWNPFSAEEEEEIKRMGQP